jgi:hypothetical protein
MPQDLRGNSQSSASFIVSVSATGCQSPSLPDEHANGNDVGLGSEVAQGGCVTVMLERPLLAVSMTGLEHIVRRLWVESRDTLLSVNNRPIWEIGYQQGQPATM